ncbi:MAG: SPOR domain-containing protein [Azoarcus sp.]|nr:SPOR domain-containing protein [Azoarcus sp.]
MRFLFILFLLLNGLAFAAIKGWLGFDLRYDDTEPERLTNQLNPEYIQFVANPPADPGVPAPQPEPPAPPPEPSVPAVPLKCVTWRGLSTANNDKLVALLGAGGISATVRERVRPTWWVRIPPQPSLEAAERHARELHALYVEEFFIIREAGPNRYAISLGVFSTEEAAKRHLEQLRFQGVRTAGVVPRTTLERQIDVTANLERVSELLAGQPFANQYNPCES